MLQCHLNQHLNDHEDALEVIHNIQKLEVMLLRQLNKHLINHEEVTEVINNN